MNIYRANTFIYNLAIFLLFYAFLYSYNEYNITWQESKRVHSNFKWYTIKTDNFNVHYHKEIEEIALSGANIAEQVLPTLLKQVQLAEIPIIDIILTSEDENMNGFATFTNTTFIWVDQNDASIWLENQKWLEQVISHELQHIVYFNKIKTWLPEPYSLGIGNTPSWFVEGIAEYYTENWRPYRSEIKHNLHVLKNTTSSMGPHHNGFSKVKLIAETYGDSCIVNILNYRDKYKLYNFEKAFKEYTGVSVKKFEDFWRKTINTYYYGIRSQKETYEDIGELHSLPILELGSLVSSFRFSSDSINVALLGKENKNNKYQSLFIATIDTSLEQKNKVKYKKDEIDFGKFHESMSWSNNKQYLAYSKYHYANNNSRVFDLCLYDTKTKSKKWITNDLRASYPIFTNENHIIFVAHKNSVSNLYKIDINNINDIVQLTNFTDDIQIVTPSISKNGNKVIFGMSNLTGNLDIYILDLITNDVSRKTFHESVDYLPIFDDSNNIIFTSHRTGMPNIFQIDENNSITQLTDSYEGVWSAQLNPKNNYILANTLNDVDSVRIVKINPKRITNTNDLNLNQKFYLWKYKEPRLKIIYNEIDRNKIDYTESIQKYKLRNNIKHIFSSIFPLPGMIVTSNWSDRIGRNLFLFSAGTYNYTLENFQENFPPSFFVFSYTNALNGPLFGLNYFYNSNFLARLYDNGSLLEKKDGLHFWTSYSYNNGNNYYANHDIKIELESSERKSIMFYDSLYVNNIEIEGDSIFIADKYGLPTPEEGYENTLTFNYKYKNKKPNSNNWYLPTQGHGVEIKAIFGQKGWNSYFQKIAIDSYFNFTLDLITFYQRLKFQTMYGDVFLQDQIWFSQDSPIYVSGQRSGNIFNENLSPRGWNSGAVIGDKMLFNTIEIRYPLSTSSFPINFLGTSLGQSSIALFQDFGIINKNSIHTIGYEAKISILNSNNPILFLSYGEAQTINRWIENKKPYRYIQMSLINPF